jgi:hypothetical protein
MDVKALYPSVPRKEAREAAEKALEKRSNKDIPTDEVLRMMDMVLENNTFLLTESIMSIQREQRLIPI